MPAKACRVRTAFALLIAALIPIVSGCKLLDKDDDESTKTTSPSPGPGPGPGAPTGSGSGVVPGPGGVIPNGPGSQAVLLRDATYAIQVTIAAAGDGTEPIDPTPTYETVRDTLKNHCVSCHGETNAYDLTKWPVKSRFPTPADAVRELLLRVQDQARPMPPVGNPRLAPAEIQTLQAWLDGGLKEKPAVPPVTAPDRWADTVTFRLRWRGTAANAATAEQEASYPWNGSGQFGGMLANVPVGGTLQARLVAVGEDGTEIASRAYESLPIGATGDYRFSVTVKDRDIRLHVVDRAPPSPGEGGVVSASAVEENQLKLAWAKATDELTASGELSYAVYLGDETTDFTDAARVVANGRKAMEFGANLTGATISGLVAGKKYQFAVVVRDLAGNVSVYTVLRQQTALDRIPPGIPTATLGKVGLTEQKVTLTWTAAVDNMTPADKLVYRVFYSDADDIKTVETLFAAGTEVGRAKPGEMKLDVTGMNPSSPYFFNVLVEDLEGNRAVYKTLRIATPVQFGSVTATAHAQHCAERLGAIRPFSCFDGEIMPIKVNGAEIQPYLSQQQAAAYDFGTGTSQLRCDKPALLGLGNQGHCIPYARVGRLKTYREDGSEHPDVDTVFTCRRYVARLGQSTYAGQVFDGSEHPLFEDIAVIQHNRVSGETCFFQMLKPGAAPIDGRRIPPPTEVALPPGGPSYAVPAASFWLGPDDTAAKGCNKCHDSDPWMHSPYIDQVRGPDGGPIVPAGAFGSGRGGKYSVIGRRGFYNWERSKAISSTVTTDTEGKSCTQCHNVGNINSCAQWSQQSAGTVYGPNLTTTGANDFHHRYWMPPAEAALQNYNGWANAGWKRAAERLQACCTNPAAAGCASTPIMTQPPPYAAQ